MGRNGLEKVERWSYPIRYKVVSDWIHWKGYPNYLIEAVNGCGGSRTSLCCLVPEKGKFVYPEGQGTRNSCRSSNRKATSSRPQTHPPSRAITVCSLRMPRADQ